MNLDAFSSPVPLEQTRSDVAAFFSRTYAWMTAGLLLTGAIAWFTATTPGLMHMVAGNRAVFYVLLFAELGLVVAFSAAAHRASAATAAAMFLVYSALTGLTFSVLFLAYTRASIAQAFFATAGGFAGLSAFGALTKRDLTPIGQFMLVGLVGLVIASVVNLFVNSSAIYWISTYAGVLIFAGLTAYDTQKLKTLYLARGAGSNLAIRGALTLYLDFINMFLMLLRLLGGKRD